MTQTISLTPEQYAHLVRLAQGRSSKKSLLRRLTIDPLVGTLRLAQKTAGVGYRIGSTLAKGVGIVATHLCDYTQARTDALAHKAVEDKAKEVTTSWNRDHPEQPTEVTSQMIYNHLAEREYDSMFNPDNRRACYARQALEQYL